MDKIALFFIGWLSVFGLVWFIKSKVKSRFFYSFLVLKVLFGCFSGWLYHYYYEAGDVLNIQKDAEYLVSLTTHSYQNYFSFLFNNHQEVLDYLFYEGEPRTLFFVKLISIVNLFNLSNFWVSSTFISVLGFCVTMYGVEQISNFYKLNRSALIIAFLLVPSVGVWTSGMMKEAVVIPSLVLAIGLMISKPSVIKYVVALLLVYVSFILKYYFVVPLVVLIGLSITIQKIGLNKWVVIGGIVVSGLGMLLHPNLNFLNFYDAVLASHNLTLASSYPVNSIQFRFLEDSWVGLLLSLPKAWYYGLFSPLPWQAYSDLSYLQSVQSLLLLVLVGWSVYTVIRVNYKLSVQSILFIAYVLFMAGLLPLCSPNIGSLSRYSVIYLPLLVSLCLQLYYEQKNNHIS